MSALLKRVSIGMLALAQALGLAPARLGDVAPAVAHPGGSFHGGGGGGGGRAAAPSFHAAAPSFHQSAPSFHQAAPSASSFHAAAPASFHAAAASPVERAGAYHGGVGFSPSHEYNFSHAAASPAFHAPAAAIGHPAAVGGAGFNGVGPGHGIEPGIHGGNYGFHNGIVGSPHPYNFNNRPNYYGGWYHGNWHDNWNRPWGYHPYGWGWGGGFGLGLGLGALGGIGLGYGMASMPYNWGYWSYSNPYFNGAGYAGPGYYNYSQPLVMAAPVGGYPPGQVGAMGTPNPASLDHFTAARAAFAVGDYPSASNEIEQAIARQPNDPVLHEFRGLTQFAMGQYDQSAATMYAVLSVGPGWDWTTLSGLYPNIDLFYEQRQALDAYEAQNPNSAAIHFLAAYFDTTAGQTQAAQAELQRTVQINPQDALSKQLLASMSGPPAGQTVPGQAAPPPQPAEPIGPPVADPNALVGNWSASRDDGAKVQMNLQPGGHFAWNIRSPNSPPQQIAGDYSLANGFLILKQNENSSLIGQVAMAPDNHRLTFKLAGENPADPGLTFTR